MLRNLGLAPGSINIPPSPVSGMLAWYAADRITSPPASGSALASWNDLSGNGYTASQGTGADQPTYNTNQQNGLPAVAFNGSSDFMSCSLSAAQKPFTLLAVCKPSNAAGPAAILGASAGQGIEWRAYSGKQDLLSQGYTDIGSSTGIAFTNGVWTYVDVTYDSSGNFAFYNAGTASGTGTQNITFAASTFQIGLGVAGEYWSGSIAEILVYGSVLATAQRQTVELYLAGKWGLGAVGGTQQTTASGVAAQAGAVGGRSSVI